ncbi:hypothetical protein PVAND_009187 [Polypedilum vanderplanki]|uniref:tRNA N(3)-methylcytidine methyltransferase n=1 Tax=Polypedilum vanderplanki TaxID=319348 RepID=A0A9J6CD00_POLVA|nr:hypothetical protein PVAND_009187 [Polypedilum vanderplanki]
MEDERGKQSFIVDPPKLTEEIRETLNKQNSRMVSEFKSNQLEKDAKKNWDLFYKRNETRFFKNRNWTVREFQELAGHSNDNGERKVMLEIGCGVGNLVFPLIEDNYNDYFIYACDFSPRAIEFVKSNELYNEEKIRAFQCDITTDTIFDEIKLESVDIITVIFVFSSIHPENFKKVADTLFKLLKPGGIILFRDYGLYDKAQLRFKPGNKIAENFYVRQDGTRTYFFSNDELKNLFKSVGFEIEQNVFVERRTINKKEDINVQRLFIQGKFKKPIR